MTLHSFFFYFVASLTALCALSVVVTHNIVRMAAWLLFTLAGVAAMLFLLGAEFLGATQLLVYVGGTMVLVVFGVMLTAQGPFISLKTGAAEWALSTLVGLLLFGSLVSAVYLKKGAAPKVPEALREGATEEEKRAHEEKMTQYRVELVKWRARPVELSDEQARQAAVAGVEMTRTATLGQSLLGVQDATPDGNVTSYPVSDPTKNRPPPRTKMSYLLPFEIVSVHLLVVLIGAAYLARAKRRRKAAP